MIVLEPKSVNPDLHPEKDIKDYCYEIFKVFMSRGESVTGNINGIQIVMFDDKN